MRAEAEAGTPEEGLQENGWRGPGLVADKGGRTGMYAGHIRHRQDSATDRQDNRRRRHHVVDMLCVQTQRTAVMRGEFVIMHVSQCQRLSKQQDGSQQQGQQVVRCSPVSTRHDAQHRPALAPRQP